MSNAPSRSSGSFSLGLGMLVIPCSLYTGTESHGIKRSEYVKTEDGYHKVGRTQVDKETGELVDNSQTVKMFECEDGSLVELSDEEIESVTKAENGTATIEAFLPVEHIGSTYITDSMYQVRPANRKVGTKSKPDANAVKAFAVLTSAMAERGVFALVQLTSRGKPKYAALLPDGRMFNLLFTDEVRDERPFPEAEPSEAELAMGLQLVDAVLKTEPMELFDTATDKVAEYATAKASGQEPVFVEHKEAEASGDLLAALAQAVEIAKSK
jgi:DNA end-binding protein Ku